MIVDDLRSSTVAEGVCELSARVRPAGAEELRLWWRLPEEFAPRWPDGSPFVAAAQVWALQHGEDTSTDLPVAPRLAANLDVIAGHYGSPGSGRVPRIAQPPVAEPPPAHQLTGSFFGLGVDSWYGMLTALEDEPQEPPLTHLIFSPDFVSSTLPQEVREARGDAMRDVAARTGQTLIQVETNLRRELSSGQNRVTLACTGLAVGLARTLIPSNTGRGDQPKEDADREHEMVDEDFSTERTLLVHYGDALRFEKVARVGRSPEALEYLYVCGRRRADSRRNCGSCEKCLRTMLGLHLAGALEHSSTFDAPLLENIARVRAPLGHPGQWSDLLAGLGDSEEDRALAAAVRLIIARHTLTRLERQLHELRANPTISELETGLPAAVERAAGLVHGAYEAMLPEGKRREGRAERIRRLARRVRRR